MGGQSNAAQEFMFEPAQAKEEEIVHYSRPLIRSTVEKAGTFIAKLEEDGVITPAEAIEWKQNVEIDILHK